MKPLCILLNGPKRSGKDEAALAAQHLRASAVIAPVMAPAKRAALQTYPGALSVEFYEAFKDVAMPELRGKTPRQVYIEYGEWVRRKNPNAIVDLWRASIPTDARAVLAPDVRFFEEFLGALLHFGAANVLLLRVYRGEPVRWMDGLQWTGDIGSYFCTSSIWGHTELTLMNNVSLDEWREEAAVVINGWISRRLAAMAR